MNQVTQAQSNIHGNYSGNRGNNNVIGDNNTINHIYGNHIYGLLDGTTLRVGNQSCAPGVGDGASGPYRLIPYCRNSSFTGRKNLIKLVKRFCEGKGHNRVALHGLGGSGKTQIALEYVYQRADESDCHVFWVQGSGVLKFSEGFRAVAQRARVPLDNTETGEEEFLLGIRRWFEGPNSGNWILVIDNCDNEVDFIANDSPIAKFIPQGTKGTLIFTTRSRQVASRQGCKMVGVGEMEEDEAQELFSKRFGSWEDLEDEERKDIAMILGSVHYFPLAVVGSAAFMIETKTAPSEYWTILQENEERMGKLLSQQFSDIQREVNEAESILSTHFVTFDRITEQMPAAAALLRLMVFFDRQNIPEELLSQSGLEGIDDSVDFRRVIGKLLGFSLITVVRHRDKTLYELHRLVQLSLQVYLRKEELNRWRATALKVISRFFPQDQDGRRRIGPAYIPHAFVVTRDSTDPVAEGLCFQMGQYFLDMGSYNNAEIQFRRCIALREEGKEYSWDDRGHWRHMRLGLVSAFQGRFDESETIHRRVLERCLKVFGPNHTDTLASVSGLALVLRDKGKYYESEKMNQRALKGRDKFFGADHPDTLSSVNNLAAVLQAQGKYDESEKMNRSALEGFEKVLGPDHPQALNSANNLATVLQDQGKYDESEQMNRRVLEGYEKVLGLDHPDTLRTVNNLAMLLGLQGRYYESEKMTRCALEGCEKVLGLDHPDTLLSANNLAMALQGQGKYDESEKMHRHVRESYRKLLGPDHPHTLMSTHNLAIVLWKRGKYDESERIHRSELERCEQVHGPGHPQTISSVNSLGLVLQNQGKYDEAETMNRRAFKGYEEVFGPDHPNTITSVNNLAALLLTQKKYDECEAMIRRAREGYERVHGQDHPDTLRSVNNLATVLQHQGKYDESEEVNRHALERYENGFGPDHPDALKCANNLAVVLQCQGKYNEAEAMNRRVLEGYERALGPDHPDTLTCVNGLAVVLQFQKKYEESEAMNQRALKGRETVLGPNHPDTIASILNLMLVLQDQGKQDESEEMARLARERLPRQPHLPELVSSFVLQFLSAIV